MIRKSLIELIFEASTIERWNDHIRPSRGFTEIDKQAHKMFYAYVLNKQEEEADWFKIIEGGIFEFLHRIVLTDIKPQIFHRLMEEKGTKINQWVTETLRPYIEPIAGGFMDRFIEYFTNPSYSKPEKRILEAAHYLATKWEFDIIYGMCRDYHGIEETKRIIDGKFSKFQSFAPFIAYENNLNLIAFTKLTGGLRFQQRWTRTERIPRTSVMGHIVIVAMLSYLFSCEAGACEKRIVNNYLGGLFHDLPEVLTRDIVSPVKNSVEGLDEVIKKIEDEQMEEKIYPCLPKSWHEQIDYFTKNEFCSKVVIEGEIHKVTSDDIRDKYNDNQYNPIDGEIIRCCDHLSAYIEAHASIRFGIKTESLLAAYHTLYDKYKTKVVGGLDFGLVFDYFTL